MSYELHNADCYEYIKKIPDKSIDLVYIDIPYLYVGGGTGGSLGYKVKKMKQDLKEKIDLTNGIDFSIFDELCRVMKRIYIYMV